MLAVLARRLNLLGWVGCPGWLAWPAWMVWLGWLDGPGWPNGWAGLAGLAGWLASHSVDVPNSNKNKCLRVRRFKHIVFTMV